MTATAQARLRQVFDDLESRIRAVHTVPNLQLLTGRAVWSVFGRQTRRLWRSPRGKAAVILNGMLGLLFLVGGISTHSWFGVLAGLVLVLSVPATMAIQCSIRSLPGRSFVLVTDRAHLVIVVKRGWRSVVLSPTDHWVDRRTIRGEKVKGQATEFRRAILDVLLEYVLEHDVVVKARAANKTVRALYANDLEALGLDPAPFLAGGRRLYVTSAAVRAQVTPAEPTAAR